MINNRYNILSTTGVTSHADDRNMGLFDFDKGVSKSRILNEALDLDGINILWRSSKTGFHLWNLSIRTDEAIALLGLRMGADCQHVQSGLCKKKWVLRIAPKWQDGEIYKPEPKLLNTWCNPSNLDQSKAHMRLFNALTGKRICEAGKYVFAGESADVESYRTFTDTMKERLEMDATKICKI